MKALPLFTVAALYVERGGGAYWDLPGVDPWDEARDARLYAGPYPVVAHPPCARWGRYWGGHPRQWPRLTLGDDGGCFQAALQAVRQWGGVLEHPEASHAWAWFGIVKPPRAGGWIQADDHGGWTCCVEQGHYGHAARKATWLYAVGTDLPKLKWGSSGQRINLARYGNYEKARRVGASQCLSKNQRAATPTPFRDLLLAMAASAYEQQLEAAS